MLEPSQPRPRRVLAGIVGSCAAIALTFGPVAAVGTQLTGPSSSADPYIEPLADGVVVESLLTVGDSVGGYRMVGIPDGLGAQPNGNGTFSLYMNHEIPFDEGAIRRHGADGSFVSEWTISSRSHKVLAGKDLIKRVTLWDEDTGSWYVARGDGSGPDDGAAIGRLCSGDLPEKSAFYDRASHLGWNGPRIFMSGEEIGSEGRAFAHLANGKSWELPRLGKFSWENALANPASGIATVVVGIDDSTPGEVYVYVGKKQKHGQAVDRAGLTNGSLYGVKVAGAPVEDRLMGVGSTPRGFTLANHGNVENWSGAQLQAASDAAGVTKFLRPEDGAWDPSHPNDFYFVTTDRFDHLQAGTAGNTQIGNSRLWRLRFADVRNPALGGTVEMLLGGTEGPQMMDNLTIDRHGHILIQEDPGGVPHLAKIWQYTIATDSLKVIAQHDPARFLPGGAAFLTIDEESSGIIDARDVLGEGWFLLDVQAHYDIEGELVQGGQLLALWNPDSAAAGR